MKINFKWILFLAFAALLAWCLTGCKAVEKYKASPQFARDCGDRFPPRTTPGKPDTITIPGITIDCDSLIKANSQPSTPTTTPGPTVPTVPKVTPTPNKVTCPPQITITQTDTIYNTAREQALLSQLIARQTAHDLALQKDTAQKEKTQRKLTTRTKQRNWLFLILIAAFGYSHRHNIIKLFAVWKS